jgi:hypothetical protein
MGSELRIASTLLGLAVLAGCASEPRRFALADPMWLDSDTNHVPNKPDSFVSGLIADGADQLFFRPVAQTFAFYDPDEATNLNSMDEVPNSAWFTNRIGFYPMTPEEAARGSCVDEIDPTVGPWVVVEAKPNGANPGFFIKAPNGKRYLLKADGSQQPERNTAADTIGSKFYYAAGYFVPCYQVTYFDPKILQIAPDATSEDAVGNDRPISQTDIDYVLTRCARTRDGLFRAGLSQFIDAKPLGPFRYEGTRGDDPNDVIPHWDRRELRGAKILAAFLGHFDSREQNSLDGWVTKHEGRDYIRHYYIDFGSSFGSRWPVDAMSRRFGFSYYFDFQHMVEDIVTLGLLPRPWHRVNLNPGSEIFGYFEWEEFDPTAWRGGYPNPTFLRATRRDQLWMARIMSRFTDEHIAAIVKTAKFSDPRAEAWLTTALIERRDVILKDAFTRDNPLDHFQLVRRTPGDKTQSLCFEDLAVKHELVDGAKVFYKMRFTGGRKLDELLGWVQFAPDPEHPHRSCVVFPIGYRRPSQLAPEGAPDDDPLRYGVLQIFVHQTLNVRPDSVVELHFYDRGPEKGYVLVGIDRPPVPDVGGDY